MEFETMWLPFALVAIISYFIGNFNSAITISKFKNKDIRQVGSGNPGTMNMSRNFGLKIGLLVFVIDILKGMLPSIIAGAVFSSVYGAKFVGQPLSECAKLCAGFFVVLGHVYPVIYKFKGGKGIASTIGVLLACEWQFSILSLAIALLFIFVTKMGAIGSFLATTPTAVFMCIMLYVRYYAPNAENGYFIMAVVLATLNIALTWWAHRQNVMHIMNGTEHDTDWWQMIKNAIQNKKIKKTLQTDETSDN